MQQEKKVGLFASGFGKAGNVPPPGDPIQVTPMVVDVDRISFFEGNPRLSPNEKYQEIKESIRETGLDNDLIISRRPTDPVGHYFIYKGGNTRLRALKELWEETRDPRFLKVSCKFQPYVSDTDALIAHLRENDLRGGMTFIDRALAVQNAKARLEAELGESLSLRKLEAAFKSKGFPISNGMISQLEYAATLNSFIPEALKSGMGEPQIRKLRKLEKATFEVWRFHGNPNGTEQQFRESVFAPALSSTDGESWAYESAEMMVKGKLLAVLPQGTDTDAMLGSFRRAMEGKGLVTLPTEAEPVPVVRPVESTPASPLPPETTNSPMPLANPVAAPSPVGLEVSSTTDVGSSLLEDDSRYGWEGGHPVDVLPLAGNQQDVREVVIDGSGRWLAQLDTLRARNYELAAKLADYVPNGRASLARIGVGYGFLVLDVFNRDYLEKLFIKANGDNTEERLDAHKTLIHTATLWWLLISISGTLHDDSLSLALAGRPHPDSQPGWSCPPDLLVSLAPPESLLFIQEENGMSAAAQYHNIYLPEHLLYHWWLRLPDTRLEWVFELIRNVRSIHELISRHAGKTGNASAWEVKTNDI